MVLGTFLGRQFPLVVGLSFIGPPRVSKRPWVSPRGSSPWEGIGFREQLPNWRPLVGFPTHIGNPPKTGGAKTKDHHWAALKLLNRNLFPISFGHGPVLPFIRLPNKVVAFWQGSEARQGQGGSLSDIFCNRSFFPRLYGTPPFLAGRDKARRGSKALGESSWPPNGCPKGWRC